MASVISVGVIFTRADGAAALAEAVGLIAVAGVAVALVISIVEDSEVFAGEVFAVRGGPRGRMESSSKTLLATPEGLLHLFLDAGVSVEYLAGAFKAEAHVIEASLREAMRKRDAISRATSPSTVEMLRSFGDAA